MAVYVCVCAGCGQIDLLLCLQRMWIDRILGIQDGSVRIVSCVLVEVVKWELCQRSPPGVGNECVCGREGEEEARAKETIWYVMVVLGVKERMKGPRKERVGYLLEGAWQPRVPDSNARSLSGVGTPYRTFLPVHLRD